MLAALKSELAYVTGLLRVVKATKSITSDPTRTLGDHLDDWVARSGDNAALWSATEKLSYRELGAHAHAYARWALAQGLNKGDAVALMMPNRPEYVAIWMGLASVGVATALINTNLVGPALAHSLNTVNARAAIVDAAYAGTFAAIREGVDPSTSIWFYGEVAGEPRLDLARASFSDAPLAGAEKRTLDINEVALYVYTSGTTGLPKAAKITHSRALRAMYAFGAAAKAVADDKAYICLPMYHTVGGLIGVGLALPFGGSAFIRERFSARSFWTDVIEQGCTTFAYIGELCRYLVNAPASSTDRAHKIRACTGNGLRPDIFSTFQSRFGIANVLEFYAATEGNAVMINFDSRPGAIGRVPNWAKRRFPGQRRRLQRRGQYAGARARWPLPRLRDRRSRRVDRRNPRRSQPARGAFRRLRRRKGDAAESAARRVQTRRRLVPHRRSRQARRQKLFLFHRPDRRHISLEGRECFDDRSRRDAAAISRRAGSGGLRRRGAETRWPRWHGGARRGFDSRVSTSRDCGPMSPSACRSMRGRCSCVFDLISR